MTKSIHEIIRLAGGAPSVSKASRIAGRKHVLTKTIYKWPSYGIPFDYWDLIMTLTDGRVTVNDLYEANRQVDRAKLRARRAQHKSQRAAA